MSQTAVTPTACSLFVLLSLAIAAQPMGDCDLSGIVDTADAALAAATSTGATGLPPGAIVACDVTRDGRLSVLDSFLIASRVAAGVPGALALFFRDVTAASEVDGVHHPPAAGVQLPMGMSTDFGAGVAVADFDRDGDHDLFLCDSAGHPNRLLANDGAGVFQDVTATAQVGALEHSHVALFADFDGDGWDDLLVVNASDGDVVSFPPARLYRNERGEWFRDVTAGSGLAPIELVPGGVTASDVDGDGDLDVAVVGWADRSRYLYRNDGNLQFTDVSVASGIRTGAAGERQWTPVFADLDGDGWQDLFVAIDFAEDLLLRNDGDGTFTDVSVLAGVSNIGNDMGVAVGDLDGDLDLDLYTTNISQPFLGDDCCNCLYVNRGDGAFDTPGGELGILHTFWDWGTCFLDVDLDGRLEVMSVNGWTGTLWGRNPAVLFYNGGAAGFFETARPIGVAHTGSSRALATLDLEGDGDLDLVVRDCLGATIVLANETHRAGAHYLHVSARGTVSNPNGVGSRIYVTAGPWTQMREIIAGGSFYAAAPLEAHFGLGTVSVASEVRVEFPSGAIVRWSAVAADQHLVVTEPPARGSVTRSR